MLFTTQKSVAPTFGVSARRFSPRAPTTDRVHAAQSSRLCASRPLINRNTAKLIKRGVDVFRVRVGESVEAEEGLIGEDAASFELQKQSLRSWGIFSGLLAGALGLLYLVWIQPSTGYGDEFVDLLSSVSSRPEITMCLILFIFAIAHSGLAGLRPMGEKLIGARAYRVIFAFVSLPLATSAVVYFVNHRYQGTQLWMLQDVPGLRAFVWIMSFISFFFLYPSTFNLLEVAAVDEPKLHLWETGVTRITRHPQAFGQGLWCLAHTLWVGNSFMVITSLGLMLHHLYGCWHGDRRLADKHGEAFEEIKARTSVVPFQAIWEGRQVLPPDYYKEFIRGPYLVITAFTIGAFWAHPLIFAASYRLGW